MCVLPCHKPKWTVPSIYSNLAVLRQKSGSLGRCTRVRLLDRARHQNQKYALWSRTYDPIDSIGRLLSITVRRNTPAEGIAHGDDDVSSSLGLMSGLSKSNPSPHLFRQGGLIPAFFFAPRLGCDQSIGQFCDLLPERMTRNHMRSVHTLPRVPLCQTPDGPAPSVE